MKTQKYDDGIPIMTNVVDPARRKHRPCVHCGQECIVGLFAADKWVRCPNCLDTPVNGGMTAKEREEREQAKATTRMITDEMIEAALGRANERCHCRDLGLRAMPLEDFKRFEGCCAPRWRCSVLVRIDREVIKS